MNTTTLTLSLATLLFAAAPLLSPAQSAPAQPGTSSTAQDLERQAREALGGVVDQKTKELTDRLRGSAGQASSVRATNDESLASAGGEDEVDPLIERLTRIEDRLTTIEGLLCDLSARSVPCAPAVPTALSAATPVAAAASAVGASVTTGFAKARIRSWHHGHDATIKLTINGLPAGRFDTDTNLDLDQFLKPGRANQLAFTIEPRGKGDATGMEVYVEAQMQGSSDYVAILQFKATKDRVADTLEIPWAAR